MKDFKISNKMKRWLIRLTIVILAIIIIPVMIQGLKSFVFSLILFLLGCSSGLLRKLTGNIDIGIGFIPFATTMFIFAKGLFLGILLSAVMLFISSVTIGDLNLDYFVYLGIMAIVSLFSVFLNYGVFVNGITLIIAFNILGLIVLVSMGFDFFKNTVYCIGSIVFNYVLLKYLGEIVFVLIK